MISRTELRHSEKDGQFQDHHGLDGLPSCSLLQSQAAPHKDRLLTLYILKIQEMFTVYRREKIKLTSSLLSRESFPMCTVRGVGEEALSEYVLLT